MTTRLDPELVDSVVSHMNEDHSDAVLAYVQAYGGKKRAATARLVDLTPMAMKISYLDDGECEQLWLDFDTPVTEAADIRMILVRMAREARALLAAGEV